MGEKLIWDATYSLENRFLSFFTSAIISCAFVFLRFFGVLKRRSIFLLMVSSSGFVLSLSRFFTKVLYCSIPSASILNSTRVSTTSLSAMSLVSRTIIASFKEWAAVLVKSCFQGLHILQESFLNSWSLLMVPRVKSDLSMIDC